MIGRLSHYQQFVKRRNGPVACDLFLYLTLSQACFQLEPCDDLTSFNVDGNANDEGNFGTVGRVVPLKPMISRLKAY